MTSRSSTHKAMFRASLLATAFALPMLISASAAFAQAGDKVTPPPVATTAPVPSPMTAAPRAPAAVTPAKPVASSAAREMTPKEMADRVEAHIKTLHTQLKITPAQQPQWDAFAQVMRDNASAMRTRFDQRGSKLTSMNAADNMQSYAMVAEQHAQDMQKLAAAFTSLYASMSAEQKTTTDTVFRAQQDRMAKAHS